MTHSFIQIRFVKQCSRHCCNEKYTKENLHTQDFHSNGRSNKITEIYSVLGINVKEKDKAGMGGKVVVLIRMASKVLCRKMFELKSCRK